MRRPIGTGQRITLEATFIPSENLKNLLERYAVLARCIESDPDANARLVVPGTAYRIPLTKNGVNVCSFSRRTSASGRLRKFGGCARSLRSRLHPARQITRPRTELQATASRALRSPALLAAYLVPATQHEGRCT